MVHRYHSFNHHDLKKNVEFPVRVLLYIPIKYELHWFWKFRVSVTLSESGIIQLTDAELRIHTSANYAIIGSDDDSSPAII